MSICACMGPQGNDPLCPCAMARAGLKSSLPGWTEADKQSLRDALESAIQEEATMTTDSTSPAQGRVSEESPCLGCDSLSCQDCFRRAVHELTEFDALRAALADESQRHTQTKNELDELRGSLGSHRETLEECYEYFKAREDCDCDGDPPEYRPNPEMNMARKCAEALGYE